MAAIQFRDVFNKYSIRQTLFKVLNFPRDTQGSWKNLAKELGYSNDEIARFSYCGIGKDGGAAESLLHTWQDGKNATINILIDALYAIGNIDAILIVNQNMAGYCSPKTQQSLDKNLRKQLFRDTIKSYDVRVTFCSCLNIAADGKNYMFVADQLGYKYIEVENFKRSSNPASAFLTDWEKRQDATFGKMLDALEAINQDTARHILLNYVDHKHNPEVEILKQNIFQRVFSSCASTNKKEVDEIQRSSNDQSDDCVICMDNSPEVVIDCGHYIMCSRCAKALVTKVCPKCRSPFSKIIKVYK